MTDQQLKLEYISTKTLTPYLRNARVHNELQIKQIAGSIQQFGFIKPIVIDESEMILAGHGAWMAAQDIGMQKIPCVRRAGLSDAQKRAYVIADNKIAENSSWDDVLITAELNNLRADDFDVGLLGFSENELKSYFAPGDLPTGGDGKQRSERKDEFLIVVVCESLQEQEQTCAKLESLGLKIRSG